MAGSTVEASIDLPFFLRLESPIFVDYDKVCQESHVPELSGTKVEIAFSRRPAGTLDRSGWPKERTTVVIKAATPARLSDELVGRFAIQNCLEILNRLITSYQATTSEVSNAGFIVPLGTSDMQLFAEIRVDGQDIRDRWPSHSINTLPLSQSADDEFARYFSGQASLPLARLFLVNATLSLERGQYSLAVFLAAAAVELRLAQVVCGRLRAAGSTPAQIQRYEGMTLGQKLQIPAGDVRSLETYFHAVAGFPAVFSQTKSDFLRLRNLVVHKGHLASREEGKSGVALARDLLRLVA